VSGHATLSQRKTESDDYKLRLLTIRSPHSTNSQHFMDLTDAPTVYINELTAEKHGVVNGEMTVIESKNGNLKIQIKVDNDIINDTVKIHQGWWHHSGCVNLLTDAEITDMGDQAAYYDTFVKIGEKTKSKN
jgi:anaerobic selenocysteine-containing dehydrogenase